MLSEAKHLAHPRSARSFASLRMTISREWFQIARSSTRDFHAHKGPVVGDGLVGPALQGENQSNVTRAVPSPIALARFVDCHIPRLVPAGVVPDWRIPAAVISVMMKSVSEAKSDGGVRSGDDFIPGHRRQYKLDVCPGRN